MHYHHHHHQGLPLDLSLSLSLSLSPLSLSPFLSALIPSRSSSVLPWLVNVSSCRSANISVSIVRSRF